MFSAPDQHSFLERVRKTQRKLPRKPASCKFCDVIKEYDKLLIFNNTEFKILLAVNAVLCFNVKINVIWKNKDLVESRI